MKRNRVQDPKGDFTWRDGRWASDKERITLKEWLPNATQPERPGREESNLQPYRRVLAFLSKRQIKVWKKRKHQRRKDEGDYYGGGGQRREGMDRADEEKTTGSEATTRISKLKTASKREEA